MLKKIKMWFSKGQIFSEKTAILGYLSSPQFVKTVVIVAAAGILILFLDYLVRKNSDAKSENKNHHLVVMKIWHTIRVVLVACVVLEVLSVNGIHMGRYVTGLGIVSAIAGFALQDPIKDIIMGISILLEGYFKIGDVVEYNGQTGKVVAFNIKTTWIFMIEDEKTVIVNNRNISNIALASDWIDVDIPIGYDQDLYYSRALCREAAKRIERLRYVYSCDFLNTQNLAESWIEYRLRVHCLPEKKYSVRRNAYAVVQDVFYEHNTEFPLSIKVVYYGDEEGGHSDASSETAKVIKSAKRRKKMDYELGKGADKSKVCLIDGSKEAVVRAMNEAERYAVAENLGDKMKLRIRLLSEEAVSMINILTDVENGEFYIQREGTDYEIGLDADAVVTSNAYEKLVSVSSSGSNEAYEGISGLIKKAVDMMIRKGMPKISDAESDQMESLMGKSILKKDDSLQWSYNIYRENEKSMYTFGNGEASDSIATDSLELSVLSKFSDDIKIAVRANHVNIRILVKGMEEG